MEKVIADIAKLIGGEIDGDSTITISGLSDVNFSKEGTLVFAENEKWLEKADNSRAAAIVAPKNMKKGSKTLIRVDNPKLSFGFLMDMFAPKYKYEPGIHPTAVLGKNVIIGEGASIQPYAVIEDNVKIGKKTVIGPFSFIGKDSEIGNNCIFNPRVTIYQGITIGDNVILHSGVVVGADGFGYVEYAGKRVKVPQIGKVIINNDVEIGANSTIDRATLGETIIGSGTKIDNLVQIAHNDIIGENCVFCAQSGVSGSCVIGNSVIIAGQAGLADHVKVEDNVIIGAQAGVPSNKILRSGQMFFGAPARSEKDTKRQMGAQARLPYLIEKVKELEAELKLMKEKTGELAD